MGPTMSLCEVSPLPPLSRPHRPKREKPFAHDDLVRLWIRRICHYYLTTPRLLGAPRRRPGRHRQTEQPMAERLGELEAIAGIPIPKDAATPAAAERLMMLQVREQIRRGEKKLSEIGWREAIHPDLRQSLAAVEKLLGLGEAEIKCLAFAVLLHSNEHVSTAVLALGCRFDRPTVIEAVAATVGIEVPEAREALAARSRLMSSQLIQLVPAEGSLDDKLVWCVRGFAQEMMSPGFEPLKALRSRIVRAPHSTLSWTDYAHLGELRDVMRAYLREALAARRPGVNVLLYGDPGVGKSEFARLLARELGCDLFEVSTEDDDGDPIDPFGRLQALRILHGFCANQHCLLAFDEAEDVFPKPHPLLGILNRQPRPKGWLNRMLETNPSVTVWLSNTVDGIDPAFVRRFDLVLHLKNPPSATREAQMRNLPVALPEPLIGKFAACDHLTPAVVQRAARVVGAIQDQLPPAKAPRLVEALINQTLQAQGHTQLGAGPAADAVYDPRFINCDLDLEALVTGVSQSSTARICLYGPPGTGKTAFGHWLAKSLQRTLHRKRASDLLSPLVGQAEKNIAAAFREAAEAGAVLMIDEVDSFLQDRAKAQRSWEVTQVNEFLTQMEQFEGVFIASTNLMEGLDAAAMRRFELKAKFDYLRVEQAQGLLAAHLAAQNLPAASAGELAELENLPNVTPGDFAALARQHRFRPLATARAWIDGLAAECRLKPGLSRRITGFGPMAKAS